MGQSVMPAAVVAVPFHNTTVLTVEIDDKPRVILKPAIEALGIDYPTQYRKLQGRSWACVGTVPIQLPGDSQRRDHVVVDVRTFVMLLATIEENRVNEAARPLLVAFQGEVADVIEAYWTRGGAINPRASEDQLMTLMGHAEGQLRVLRLCDGLVDRNWLEAKARHVAARALGEEPEIDPVRRPLTVGEYLQEHGVVGVALRTLSPKFGKRVKAAYVNATGHAPPMVERFIEGALRQVAGYTERDRPIFDQVWKDMT